MEDYSHLEKGGKDKTEALINSEDPNSSKSGE